MGRVGGSPFNPLTAGGQTIVGGYGTPLSYANRALLSLGAVLTASTGGAQGTRPPSKAIDGIDGGDALDSYQSINSLPVPVLDLNLGLPRRIGRIRLHQYTDPDYRTTAYDIYSADAAAGPWTLRHQWPGPSLVDNTITFGAPITAQFWRVDPVTGGTNSWIVVTLEAQEVTTVGAGNQLPLAPPASPLAHFLYDLSAGVPAWHAPELAEADLGATIGEANNAASATLMATKAEHDATRAKVNALIAKLELAGTLAP